MQQINKERLVSLGLIAGLLAIIAFMPCECRAGDFGAATDQYDNVYPSYCPDIIADVPEYRAWLHYADLAVKPGARVGYTVPPVRLADGTMSAPYIVVTTRLAGWRKRDVERHEICHGIDLIAGRRTSWHPEPHVSYVEPPQPRCGDAFHC